jgi:SAM-dependent methyltransferase
MRAGTMLSARTVGAVPGEWDGTAEAYARSFALLCAGAIGPLLEAVAERTPAPATLLDVGTGPGTVAREAARRGWHVTGSDSEPGMLELAARDGDGIRWVAGALPDLPFDDDAFDAVTANFVVNHTHRPRAAISDLVRVARETVAFTIWPRRRTVLNGLWSGVVADAGAVSPPGTAVDAGHDIDRSEEGLAALLDDLGLRRPRVESLEWDFVIEPAALWSGVDGGAGTIGTTFRAQDRQGRDRMRAAYLARTKELTADDGLLHLPSSGLLAIGSR